MKRLNRITAILTLLQSKRIITGGEIASRFDVSLRTAYRDIQSLQEAGIPIGSEQGVGYFLVDGYTLPPVAFSEDEANALVTAQKLIAKYSEESLAKNYNSALTKIKSVLKPKQKDKAELLESRIAPSVGVYNKNDSHLLSQIQKSITSFGVIKIEYLSGYKNELTKRVVEPMALYFTENNWVLIAHCRLRNDSRDFRIDRINSFELQDEKSKLSPHFRLTDFYKERYEYYKKYYKNKNILT